MEPWPQPQATKINQCRVGIESAAPVPAASRSPPEPARESPASGKAAGIPSAVSSAASRTPYRVPLLRDWCSCALEFFFQQLLLVQIGVVSRAFQQLIVGAMLDNFPVLQHHDLILIPHRPHPLRAQNCCPSVHH